MDSREATGGPQASDSGPATGPGAGAEPVAGTGAHAGTEAEPLDGPGENLTLAEFALLPGPPEPEAVALPGFVARSLEVKPLYDALAAAQPGAKRDDVEPAIDAARAGHDRAQALAERRHRDAQHAAEDAQRAINDAYRGLADALPDRLRQIDASLDAPTQTHLDELDAAAAAADRLIVRAAQRTRTLLGNAARHGTDAVAANLRTAAAQIKDIVDNLSARYTETLRGAADECKTVGDEAHQAVNRWRLAAPTNFPAGVGGIAEAENETKRRAADVRAGQVLEPLSKNTAKAVAGFSDQIAPTRQSIAASVEPPLRTRVTEITDHGAAAVTTAHSAARDRLKDQSRQARDAIERMRVDARARLFARRRAARATLEALGTRAQRDGQRETGSAQQTLGASVRPVLGLFGAAIDRVQDGLRQAAPSGTAALENAATVAPASIEVATARAVSAQGERLEQTRRALEASMDRHAEQAAQDAELEAALALEEMASIAAADLPVFRERARHQTAGYSQMRAGIDAAVANWSRPLQDTFGDYISRVRADLDKRHDTAVDGRPAFITQVNESKQPFIDWATPFKTPATAPTLTTALDDAWTAVLPDLRDRGRRAGNALSSGIIDVVDENALARALRDITAAQGTAIQAIYKDIAGRSLDEAMQLRILTRDLDTDEYDIAIAYLSGNSVEGKRLELEASRGWVNDDEARIEEVMRSMTQEQLDALHATPQGMETVENVRGVLGGLELDVFNALNSGNPARADALQWRDRMDRARSRGEYDTLTDTAAEYGGAAVYMGRTVDAEQRRALVHAEFATLLRESGAGGRGEVPPALLAEGADPADALVAYATRSTDVLRTDWLTGPRVEQEAITGVRVDLLRDIVRQGEDSVAARQSRLAVEFEREGGPNMLRVDRALVDPRLNPNNYPEGNIPPDRLAQARADRQAVIGGFATRYGRGEAAGADGGAAYLARRIDTAYGADTAGAAIVRRLATEEVPTPQTASLMVGYAMRHKAGTDEALMDRVVGRMNRDEIAQMRIHYGRTGRDMYADMGVYGRGIFGDLSGDERLKMERRLLGVPRNDRERAEVAAFTAQQQRDETGFIGGLLTSGDFQDRALSYEADRLAQVSGIRVARNADGTPAFTGGESRFRDGHYEGSERAEFEAATAGSVAAAEAYAQRVDTYANFAANAIMVVGAIVATVLTAGGAGPLLLAAVAAGTGLTAMIARRAISGGRYGWEQAMTDLAMTLVQTLTAGVGASLSLASRGGATAVQAGMRAGLTGRLPQQIIAAGMGRLTGTAVGDTLLIGAITNGLNAAGTAGLSEATWEKGFGRGLSEMFGSTLAGAFTGTLTAGIGHGLGAIRPGAIPGMSRVLGGAGRNTVGELLQNAGPIGRGLGQAAIAGVSGFGGRAAELTIEAGRGRYRGDAGDLIMESTQAGLLASAQGFGEGVGEHFAEGARTRRITTAADEINQARQERGLAPLAGDAHTEGSALRLAAEDLVFMNQNGHFGRDGLGRALNLDHVATHAGIAPTVATTQPHPIEVDAMRAELMRHVPPERHAEFAEVPIRVLPAAEFQALTRSQAATAVTLIEDGHPVVVVREGAPISHLADEGPHLLQARSAGSRDRTARLDEATLSRWDSLDLDTQLDLYRNKIGLEIEAHESIARALEAQTPDSAPARARHAAEADRNEATLRNLRERLAEVEAIGPARRAEIAAGAEPRPQYLEQAPRLFSKEEGRAARGRAGRGDTDDEPPTLPDVPPTGHPEGDRDGRLFPRTAEEIAAMTSRRDRGNTFNDERAGANPHNEVRLVPGEGERGQPRVDAYDVGRTITERKYSQLAELGDEAGIARINELLDTYPEGRRIADVPSNDAALAENRARFGDDILRGRPVLEVPEQHAPVPLAVLEHAERNGVAIVDPEGRRYTVAHPDGEDGRLRASARDPDSHADAMREALLRHVPADQQAAMGEVPIVVLPAAAYEALTGSRRGRVVTLIQDGQPVVVIREGTPVARLADEGPHLSQLHDPRTRTSAARLDETVMRQWDRLDLDTQLDLYRNKIELEIDAHERIGRSLQGETPGSPESRARHAYELDRNDATLRNLRARLGEVQALEPAERAAIRAGGERPQYLDQPARLFSKDSAASPPRPSGYEGQPEVRGPRIEGVDPHGPEALRQRHEDWVEGIRRGYLDVGSRPPMTEGVAPPPGRPPWHDSMEAAYAAYDALLRQHGGTVEAGIVRNADTGEYMVVKGNPTALRIPMEAMRQETVLHYHPDYGPALYRGPSGTDLANTAAVALATGRPVTEFIEYGAADRRGRTAFTLTPVADALMARGRRLQIDIEFIHPTTGEYVHQRFASRQEWSAYYHGRATALDPDGPLYRSLLRAWGVSDVQIDAAAARHRAEGAPEPLPAEPAARGRPTQAMVGDDDPALAPFRGNGALVARTVFEPFVGPSLASSRELLSRYPGAEVIASEASHAPLHAEIGEFEQQGGRFIAARFGETLPDNSVDRMHVRFPLPHEKAQEMAIQIPALLAAHPGRSIIDIVNEQRAGIESITNLGPHALRTLRPGGELEVVYHERSIHGEIESLGRQVLTDAATGERYRLVPTGPAQLRARSVVAPHSGYGIPAEATQAHVVTLRKVRVDAEAGGGPVGRPPGSGTAEERSASGLHAPAQAERRESTPAPSHLTPQALIEIVLGRMPTHEMEALREAGLTDAEIARQVELLGDVFLFRGTSAGHPGNPVLQRFGISPASTDPLVATVFALESRAKGGEPILLFGERSRFATEIDVGNVRRVLEREVQVNMLPAAFEAAAPVRISADLARQILAEMGIATLPTSIASPQDATLLLQNLPRLTPEQIHKFLARVRSHE